MSTYARQVGMTLRQIRESRRWSLLDVEQLSGGQFMAVTIGSYERADRAANVEYIARYAAFLGVTTRSILEPRPYIAPPGPAEEPAA